MKLRMMSPMARLLNEDVVLSNPGDVSDED